MDEEVYREIWNGAIPVMFNLSQRELQSSPSIKQTEPLYILIHRSNYLPTVFERLRDHFQPNAKLEDIWISFEGTPLKWNVPFGVLFDHFGFRHSLPWQLSFNARNFPIDKLLKFTDEECLKEQFLNSLKEAMYLRERSTDRIRNLSLVELSDLWMAVKNHHLESYLPINRKLFSLTAVPRNIPLRVSFSGQLWIRDILPVSEDGKELTLGDALHRLFPKHFVAPNCEPSACPLVLIHGISPPFETPLAWLGSYLCCADNFVYVALHERN